MKRPFPLYLVATWSFFVECIFAKSIGHLIAPYITYENGPKDIANTLTGTLMFLVILHIVYLIKLKAFSRWLSIGFFGIYATSLAWNLLKISLFASKFWILAAMISILLCLNLLCIWYLSRKSFREFATTYVTAKEQEIQERAMQKISSKKTSYDLRS
jgi:hypothetical protein